MNCQMLAKSRRVVQNPIFRSVPERLPRHSIAIDLIPLAVLKPIILGFMRFTASNCNRPHTACGIETKKLDTDIPKKKDCNRPHTACGIETK